MVRLGDGVDVDKDSEEYRSEKEIIAPGWQGLVMTGSELKDNSNKDGKLLVLTFTLTDGSGRTVVDRLNYINKSETAQFIARARLAHIAKLVGVKGQLTSTDPLHGRPLDGKITIEEYQWEGKDCKNNKIADYRMKTEQAKQTASGEQKGW